MNIVKHFSGNEKLAIGLFLLFFPVYWFILFVAFPSSAGSSAAVGTTLLWIVFWLLVLIIATCVAIGAVFFQLIPTILDQDRLSGAYFRLLG